MTGGQEGIVERLRAIEEELRELAYDRLHDALDRPAMLAEERRLHQARRAVEKAIRLLTPETGDADPA